MQTGIVGIGRALPELIVTNSDMEKIVNFIDTVITNHENKAQIASIKNEINEWMVEFPLFK